VGEGWVRVFFVNPITLVSMLNLPAAWGWPRIRVSDFLWCGPMSEISLSGLHFYPVKSLRGISLDRVPLDRRGLRYDRHWMLIDQNGDFLSQRRIPRMALICTRLIPGGLRLCAPGMPDLELPLESGDGTETEVLVWEDRCRARLAGDEADQWLSRFLDHPCRMVYMPEATVRPVDPAFGHAGDQVAFSDGFPLLLISEASLDDLNRRLETPLPMQRFRPNLVVRGCAPYAEDGWRRIRIGEIEFRVVKPCSRCVITTIDPETADKGVEPLRTFNDYRRQGNKVYFGQNLIHDGVGELTRGMAVEILE